MTKICIVLLIGIPGAGKTTFANKLPEILSTYGHFKVHTIIYDNILQADYKINYKLHRQQAFTGTRNLIKDILQKADDNDYVIAVDDNMYFKSMRYEYYKLAREYQISFFQVHFDVNLSVALNRNANRDSSIPNYVINRMAKKFEKPCENWEKHSLTINSNHELDNNILSKFFVKLQECLKEPVINVVPSHEKMPLTRLQTIDLALRKLVHKRIEQDRLNATRFCNKRVEIFNSFKNGQIDICDDLDDSELLLFLDTLFEH